MKKALFKLFLTGSALLLSGEIFANYIGYIYPAGGQQGTSVEIAIGGQQFSKVDRFRITGGGITVKKITVLPYFPVPDSTQRPFLMKWIKNRIAGDPTPPPKPENTETWRPNPFFEKIGSLTELEFEILTFELTRKRNALQDNPSIRQFMIATLEIAPDATPGRRELRFGNGAGLSNPFPFYVGTAPEIREGRYRIPPNQDPNPELPIPGTLNGMLLPGGQTDVYHFQAEKNQTLTFLVRAREFKPFVGDGVPGHFQPVISICDAKGKEIAFADDHFFNPDPVLVHTFAEKGKYQLKIRDSIYRGRRDFVYRVEASIGRNFAKAPASTCPKLPVFKAKDVSDTVVKWPCRIDGVTAAPGVEHRFQFTAKAGQKVMLEAFASRIGSPFDALLKVRNDQGEIILVKDDHKLPLIGTVLQNFDACAEFIAPADGTYTVEISDTTGNGSKAHLWQLRIDHPRPDFQVYATRSMLNIPQGGIEPLRILAIRKEGFTGDIRFFLHKESAAFCKLEGSPILPAGSDTTNLTLRQHYSKKRSKDQPLKLFAEAKINGKVVRVPVLAADEAMQAFAYTHLIPAEELLVNTRGKMELDGRYNEKFQSNLTLAPGGAKTWILPVKNTATWGLQAVGETAPEGIQYKVVPEKDFLAVQIKMPETMKEGTYPLVIRLEGVIPPDGAKLKRPRKVQGWLPALSLTVKKTAPKAEAKTAAKAPAKDKAKADAKAQKKANANADAKTAAKAKPQTASR